MVPKNAARKRGAPLVDQPVEEYVPKRVRRSTRSMAAMVDSQGFTWQSPEPEMRPPSPVKKKTKKKANLRGSADPKHETTENLNKDKPAKPSEKGSTKSKAKSKPNAAAKTSTKASPKSSAKPTAKSVAKSDQIDRKDGETCFWLMKAEPESRLEKGVDVKFSIDDLAAKDEPEAWDGVRNPVAQKNMRSMRAGELAFFYHSNCKVPGIAGVMQIVQEQTPDESAFDPQHPYYDPKSDPEKPRWCVVHVRFVKKFDDFVPLKKLQEHAGSGAPLETLQTLKMSRLSVSRVMPDEWTAVLGLAGVEQKEIDDLVAELGPV